MAHSNFLHSILLLFLLLILNKRALADDGSTGYHGYERDALLSLKAGFKNPFLDGNWTGIMCYMNETPYWYGIQCLNGRVSGIVLERMGLFGDINADALVNLTELQTLSFKNNFIAGNMMDFTYSQKLRNVDLSGNGFDGEIPLSLLNLDSLESLQLQYNNLTGSIPGFNQSSLKAFNVSYNNLSGAVPETKTLQSFGISSYLGNENLCGPPTPTLCSTRSNLSKSNTESSGGKSNNNERFAAILVVVDVVALVVILFLFIIYYKKYKKLRTEIKGKDLLPRVEEHDSTIVEREMEKKALGGERGKLVFLENNGIPTLDLDDLLKASAEGLGKGNFGNCYKATLEVGTVVVVKRLRDLKPLNSEEFVRQARAIADLKHPNLLPLSAYYYSKDEKLFLYKFASHGNLYNRLHGNFFSYVCSLFNIMNFLFSGWFRFQFFPPNYEILGWSSIYRLNRVLVISSILSNS